MAMNKARRTANLNNILTYDTLGNSTLIANLTVEGLTGAGFVKADAAGLLSVDTAAYTVTTGATNYLPKITAPNTLGQSLVYDNGTSVLVNTAVGVPGYSHAFQVMANGAGGLVVSTTDVASAIGIVNSSSANKTWDISPYGNHLVINESGVATRMKFDAGGNITIGDITNSGHKLEIVGSFRTTGTNTLSALQGVGDRMVVANTNGVLTTQAIPTGNITGTGAAGQVTYWTGASAVSGSNNLFWDNTNGRLGIGTNVPTSAGHIVVTNNTLYDSSNLNLDADILRVQNSSATVGTAASIKLVVIGTGGSSVAAITAVNTGSSNAALTFATRGGSTPTPERMRLTGSGNLLINSTTDNGQRLQVYGDTLLRGSGNTSATTALTVQNSDGTNMLRVTNNNFVYLQTIFPLSAASLNIYHRENITSGIVFSPNNPTTLTSGTRYTVITNDNFLPTSGNSSYAAQLFQPTINQTGGANGITRGLYIIPTLTAAADWRSIQWDNNSGWGLYGAGTANNYLAGSLGIGTTSLTSRKIAIGGNTVGSGFNFGIMASPIIQSDATNYVGFNSEPSTQAATFTLTTLRHFSAIQSTIGASSSIISQMGFWAHSSMVGATSNYGFYGDIASGTGRWNLYMNGTADNYLAGNLGIGITPTVRLQVSGDTILRGSGNTNTTTALTVQDSDSTNLFYVQNGGFTYNRSRLYIGGPTTTNSIRPSGTLNREGFEFASSCFGTDTTPDFRYISGQGVATTITSGSKFTFSVETPGFAPTSGTATYNLVYLSTIINQTGGANGITRGLYINPTLTSAADWRSIQWSNNSGWGLYGAGTANNYLAGRLGIGSTALASENLRVAGNIGTATNNSLQYGIVSDGTVQSTVTVLAANYLSTTRTQATAFTIPYVVGYFATQGTFGASSVVTEQMGFWADYTLTGATKNYGFFGNIPSGTGRWNLYMNSTADNYLAGNLGLGVTPSAWDTTYKVYEAPGNAFVAGFSGQIQIGQNAYYSGGWKYKTTAVASKYYQVNGTHIWQTAPSGIIDTSITYTQAMTLDASGNLGIGITPTVRLQVSGDTILRGSGNTSATNALSVQNSDGNLLMSFNNAGSFSFGPNGQRSYVAITDALGTLGSLNLTAQSNITISNTRADSASLTNGTLFITRDGVEATTAGTQTTLLVVGHRPTGGFAPTSGTALFTAQRISPIINQTGGANGVTRGLYINPTLTAAADWRSIQWDNNTGYGLYGEGTAPNLIKGNLIIGPSALNQAAADSSLHIGKAMNAQSSYGSTIRYEAQNGVIAAHALNISLSTQDAAFTISNIYGVSVIGTIKGASNTITNQYGFFVNSTFIGATNNYAYWGDVPAGANTWNLYMNGGANNYLAGSLGIGSNALTGYGFRNNKQLTGSSTSIGNGAEGQIQTGVSVAAYYYRTISNQIVGTSTTSIIHYGATQGTLSGVSNNQYGFYAFDLSVSTANYGFYGALTSGANKWNLYMNGTANNYMNGALLLGNTTTDGANKLQVTGSSALNGVTYVNTNASIAGYGHSLQVLANASGGMIVSTTNSASAIGIVNSASSNKTWDISPFNNDLSFNESGVGTRMYLSAGGRIGLGIAPVTLDNATVTIGGNVTTGTGPSALLISPTVQSTATSSAVYSLVRSSTQAASFVLPSLFYYFTSEGTFGAGSSVTSQYGYYANGNMTGATNNYGFYGGIPAGTGRWNLYMNGDAHNYLAGNVGIGSGGTNDLVKLYIVGSTTGTTIYNFAYAQPQISTSLSSGLFVFRSNVSGTGTASTTDSITHFIAQQSSLGSATATNQYGFRVDTSLTGATNNYGFYGNIASAANRWNLYMAGTASNHLNGTTLIGTATDDGVNKLQVAGSIKATGILRSDITQAAVTNNVSISLLGSNITTYAAGFSMANAGYGLNGVYAQHEQRFGGNATFAHGNINGAGLMLNKLAPTAAGTVTITQQTGQLRTMSNLHLMTQFEGNNNLTVTDMSGLHIYGHYRTSGTGTLTVSNAYYGVFLADPNEFGAGATVTGSNYGFYQQGAAPYNYFGGKVSIGTTATDGTSKLRISGLPTSATGLLAGEVWNDAGTLKIA